LRADQNGTSYGIIVNLVKFAINQLIVSLVHFEIFSCNLAFTVVWPEARPAIKDMKPLS
jgi:hypothetical protein